MAKLADAGKGCHLLKPCGLLSGSPIVDLWARLSAGPFKKSVIPKPGQSLGLTSLTHGLLESYSKPSSTFECNFVFQGLYCQFTNILGF